MVSRKKKNEILKNMGIPEIMDRIRRMPNIPVSNTNDKEPVSEDEFENINEVETDENGKITEMNLNISMVEFAVYNSFLFGARKKKFGGLKVESYGTTSSIGVISYGGQFKPVKPWWFKLVKTKEIGVNATIQTSFYKNQFDQLICSLNIALEEGISDLEMAQLYEHFKSTAFNNSEYKGKCLKVTLLNGCFENIEILPLDDFKTDVILSDVQKRYIEHFRVRIARGGNARFLLNGVPGAGKTESIRNLIYHLTPDVTFVIPVFENSKDLTTIMEACEIFEPGVIIMDDIDLYLGNRDRGSATTLLGEFLSFFDGVKKRKISLLASTNSKDLVDEAGRRPGRFNAIIDFGYLEPEQVNAVIDIHLDEKWRVPEVYKLLKGNIGGKKAKLTGAFIANLGSNIREMSMDDNEWSLKDTLMLIEDSYRGFYASTVESDKQTIGFKTN